MQISEILTSTNTWAAIAGIELKISGQLVLLYRQNIAMIKTAKTIKGVVTSDQWYILYSEIQIQTNKFINDSTEYIAEIESINIKNDADLNSRLSKVKQMILNIRNLYNSL